MFAEHTFYVKHPGEIVATDTGAAETTHPGQRSLLTSANSTPNKVSHPLRRMDSMAATMHISDTSGAGHRFDPRWRPTSSHPLTTRTAEFGTRVGETTRQRTASDGTAAVVYWRRRIVVGLVLMVVGAGLWTMVTWAVNSSVGVDPVGADRPAAVATDLYVVQPGDTLWSIAAEIDPTGDVRATVDALAGLNGGSSLSVGQRLTINR
jgi:LysM repeat protein